jgi:hypothetical protein
MGRWRNFDNMCVMHGTDMSCVSEPGLLSRIRCLKTAILASDPCLRAQTIQSCEVMIHVTDRKYVLNVGVECAITLRATVCFRSINVHEYEDVG